MNFTFDWNESSAILFSILFMSLFLRIRKHFHPIVVIIIWVASIAYVATIDYALAATPFALYYCGDNETYEPIGTWIHVFLYPPFAFLYLYYYKKWSIRGINLVFYIALWTCYSILFEWINLKTGLFTYTGWSLYYSIPAYPLSAWVLIKLLHFIERNLPSPNKA